MDGDIFERIAQWADRHSPQTLFARALIILVVPMLLLQALSAWWFYSQRGDNVTNRLAVLLVRDLRVLIALRSDFPDDAHRAWILNRSAQDLLLFVSFRKGIIRSFKEPEYFDIVAREVQGEPAAIARALRSDFSDGGSDDRMTPTQRRGRRHALALARLALRPYLVDVFAVVEFLFALGLIDRADQAAANVGVKRLRFDAQQGDGLGRGDVVRGGWDFRFCREGHGGGALVQGALYRFGNRD